MTAVIDTPNESTRGWVVDVATHRIVRKGRVPALARREGSDQMEKQELNPIEDVKGAAKLITESHPLRAIKEALETGAELLEPSEADVRAMEIEPDTRSETPAGGPTDAARPHEAHPHPDSRELEREHPKF